jgi:nucleoside-diphosphate-sugar epimerase
LRPNLPDGRRGRHAISLQRNRSARRARRRLAVLVRLLVLGGTAWLGRAIAEDAAARGHEVTCLARGASGAVPPNVCFVPADRDGSHAYDDARQGQWDAVVDVARQPGQVRRAAGALEPVVGRYVFVSSANVYASQRELDQDESAALLPPLASDVMESPDRYGEAKVACEQAITDQFGPGRTLIARAGLIGGPGDPFGRSGYWPWRFARPSNRAGAILVPDALDVPTALIDVRDIAAWLVSSAENGTVGIFNVGANRLPLREHLAVARAVAGHTGPLVAVSAEWLADHGVRSWMGPASLPLWLDDPDWYGMNARNTDHAGTAGLRTRPLTHTLADTLTWELSRPTPGPHGAGLTDDEERRLLDAKAAGR